MPRIIDLSVSIDETFWEPEAIGRKVLSHREGADVLGASYLHFKAKGWFEKLVCKLLKPRKYFIDHKDFPDEMGLSLMTYTLTTHTGTHLDAPYHYGWRKGAERPKTVTEIPLEWCFSDGVLLDFSHDSGVIDGNAVREKLIEVGHVLKERDIVLINTGAFRNIGSRKYFTEYRGIDKSALEYLTGAGVKIIGTDAFSFDAPFCEMIDAYKQTGDQGRLWPSHFYGRDCEYIQIERLGYLENLPVRTGFKVCCFPIKLEKADAAWSRVVALL
ncbi:cyclase family protein [Burkholderia sp. AU30280]|uniref:cyclase family protein n=1 Tax=unclassified Burkholderia TaxID=2613784 RepID=UPI001CF2AB27|nr:cyclase family protein [Burkholderia sp. AU30280]MCA8277161.1 cyclase family protein [Burkholderia sp. AU30280]